MAGSVNKVILVGNLGADPEIRYMQNQKPVCNLRIATSESWNDRVSGQRQERTEWHRVVIFNEGLCRVAESYLKKGSKVYIEGKLQTRQYEQDGITKYSTEIVLQAFNGTLTMLSSSSQGTNTQNQQQQDQGGFGGASNNGFGGTSSDFDDDIPF